MQSRAVTRETAAAAEGAAAKARAAAARGAVGKGRAVAARGVAATERVAAATATEGSAEAEAAAAQAALTRTEETWLAAVTTAALTLSLPKDVPASAHEGWALVDAALQVLRGAACASAAVAVPDVALEP